MKKLKVGVVFGGKSCEHEISLLSAKNVIEALDKEKYEPVLIGIDKKGGWHIQNPSGYLEDSDDPKQIRLSDSCGRLTIAPERELGSFLDVSSRSGSPQVDIVFPVLHGTYGEDGTVQGLLRMAGIPFVGADVLGSAVAMDKEVMKRLLKEAGIPVAKWIAVPLFERTLLSYSATADRLGVPFFVKPANAGSSVGISKVRNEEEFKQAIKTAFLYDKKILLEEYIEGREIECSVLGSEEPIASLPGEVISRHEFYSYEAKYLDKEGADLEIPARLDPETTRLVQSTAVRAFKALCCEGMARVDCFLQPSGRLVLNEINTIPGFTKISMYPKLWEASGLSYSDLLDRLIVLGLARYQLQQQIDEGYRSLPFHTQTSG